MRPDETRDNIEVRFHKDGTFDEVVMWDRHGKGVVHIEQMDDHYFWMRFYGITQDLVVHMGAKDGKVWANHEWDDVCTESDEIAPDFKTPEAERQSEVGELLNKYGVRLLLQTVAEIYKEGRKAEFEQDLIKDLEGIKDKFVAAEKKHMDEELDQWLKEDKK